MELPDAAKCRIMVDVLRFVEENPEKVPLLEQFLRDGKMLYGVKDVCRWTGWSEGHVRKLCQAEELPHIPGKELKFFYGEVMDSLRKMQKGGEYGRRRSKKIRRAA